MENKGTNNNLLAIDATEIPIEELKKLKLLFSGKKRQHSLKSQIIIDLCWIILVSASK
ncbi:hypothetical protein [Spiroplasma endosymbiont of Asaphidion curtum]|uniref:hypothetical protein n=1 Tax=Spiroplasma endosymbiont of Asaphidion curtum TaxID=3066281 RepID=UPI00313E840B